MGSASCNEPYMGDSVRKPVLLVLTQVYVPDPAALGQYLHDAVREIAVRGVAVRVCASARKYGDATTRYPKQEKRDGVDVRRFDMPGLGDPRLAVRIPAQLLLLARFFFVALFMRNLCGILVSTSPPFASSLAVAISYFRRVPIIYWVMDINPDQAVLLGAFRERSIFVRIFDGLNRRIIRRAARIVVLDPFMETRMLDKIRPQQREEIRRKTVRIPLWPLQPTVLRTENRCGVSPFRSRHGWDGKCVVMYSGNHAWTHPLGTVLEAARRLVDIRDDIRFVFIGDGRRKAEVEAACREMRESGKTSSIVSLPYQPFETLTEVLGAADVHLISIGNGSVGIVHPCKIYDTLALERPHLILGPARNHLSFLLGEPDWNAIGRQVEHGDIAGMVRAISELAGMSPAARAELGYRGRELLQEVVDANARERFVETVLTCMAPGRDNLITGTTTNDLPGDQSSPRPARS